MVNNRVNNMVNAAAEIHRWVQGINADNAFALYALPLLAGLQAAAAVPARA